MKGQDSDTLVEFFSQERLKAYQNLAGGNLKELISIDIELGSKIYPALYLLEISLRNKIDDVLSQYFSDNNWLINNRIEEIPQSRVGNRNKGNDIKYVSVKIKDTCSEINRQKKEISQGTIIAMLNFGIWTSFFEPGLYGALDGCVITCFKDRKGAQRKEIAARLKAARKLRNRIFHYEPIIISSKYRGKVTLQELDNHLSSIEILLGWLHPDLVALSQQVCSYRAYLATIH